MDRDAFSTLSWDLVVLSAWEMWSEIVFRPYFDGRHQDSDRRRRVFASGLSLNHGSNRRFQKGGAHLFGEVGQNYVNGLLTDAILVLLLVHVLKHAQARVHNLLTHIYSPLRNQQTKQKPNKTKQKTHTNYKLTNYSQNNERTHFTSKRLNSRTNSQINSAH